MRVFVTGAGGMVGSTVVRHLHAAGHEVVAGVHRADSPRLDPLRNAKGFAEHRIDMGAPRLDFPDGPVTVVINCAAHGATPIEADDGLLLDVNVAGAVRLWLETADRGIARFIQLGTAFEYGPHSDPVTEDTPLTPLGPYAASKAAASILLREHARSREHGPVLLRFFNLFGLGDHPNRLLSRVFHGIRERKPVALSSGLQKRDFLHVEDAARALRVLATADDALYPASEVFNVGSNEPMTVRDVVTRVARHRDALELMQFGEIGQRSNAPTDLYGYPERWRAFCERVGSPWKPTPLEQAVDACLGSTRRS